MPPSTALTASPPPAHLPYQNHEAIRATAQAMGALRRGIS